MKKQIIETVINAFGNPNFNSEDFLEALEAEPKSVHKNELVFEKK